MNLLKIASLALAGIMAVSMLAGCKDGGNGNSGSSSSGTTVTTTPIVSAVNSELSKKQKELLTFSSDAKLASALSKAAEEVTAAMITNAGTPSILSYVDDDEENVIKEIENAYDGSSPTIQAWAAAVPAGDVNARYLLTYMVDGSVASVDDVASFVVKGANGLVSLFYQVNGIAGNDDFNYEYTGYAEMTEVTNDNTGDSAYLVAVLIERDVTAKV